MPLGRRKVENGLETGLFPARVQAESEGSTKSVRWMNPVADQLIALLPRLRRFALALCRSGDKADDLVQQACERALASADRFQPGTRFDAWMFRILRNLWIDDIRRRKTAGVQDDIDDRHDLVGSSGEADVDAKLTLNDTAAAILKLPDDQRDVLMLVCVEEVSYREAAEVLDVPIGTVMSRLARARKALAEAVGITEPAMRSSGTAGARDR